MAALLLVGGFFSSSPPLHIDKTETKDQLYSLNHKMTKEELQQERSYSSNMTKEELEQELEEMFVGREPLRKTLIDIFIWAQDLRDRQEIDNSTIRRTLMHTVFIGNPGTGKTMVAKKLGDIFKSFGLAKSGHVVEALRGDLVGESSKQTAQNVERQMQKAKDGILFVDEAYRLSSSSDAVEEILLRLNATNDFILILAGYPDEMQKLFLMNNGLPRRFYQIIKLDDYTPHELTKICNRQAHERGYVLDQAAEQKFLELLDKNCSNPSLERQGPDGEKVYESIISQYNAGLCDHLLFAAEKEKALRMEQKRGSLSRIEWKREINELKEEDFTKGFEKWLSESSQLR